MRKLLHAPLCSLLIASLASLVAMAVLPACSSVKEPDASSTTPAPPPPPPSLEDLHPPQINSSRPRVIEYDGNYSDSDPDYSSRGGRASLDGDLEAAGFERSPLHGWIRN